MSHCIIALPDFDITDCIKKEGFYQIYVETLDMQYGFQLWPDGELRESSLYLVNKGKLGQAMLAAARIRLKAVREIEHTQV
jgi:hypothetical protein